jgi:hypothetical protein
VLRCELQRVDGGAIRDVAEGSGAAIGDEQRGRREQARRQQALSLVAAGFGGEGGNTRATAAAASLN